MAMHPRPPLVSGQAPRPGLPAVTILDRRWAAARLPATGAGPAGCLRCRYGIPSGWRLANGDATRRRGRL